MLCFFLEERGKEPKKEHVFIFFLGEKKGGMDDYQNIIKNLCLPFQKGLAET